MIRFIISARHCTKVMLAFLEKTLFNDFSLSFIKTQLSHDKSPELHAIESIINFCQQVALLGNVTSIFIDSIFVGFFYIKMVFFWTDLLLITVHMHLSLYDFTWNLESWDFILFMVEIIYIYIYIWTSHANRM